MSAKRSRQRVRDDRVLGYTRGLSAFIVPFLVVAFVILYLFPEHTPKLWAWPIAASMNSMMLASAYIGGAYFFLRVIWDRHWHEVAAGFLAVTAFASLLGIATVLHWDLFSHHHASFWAWAGLYFTAPFLVIGAWLANRRYGVPVTDGDVLLRPAERVVITALSVLALATGVVMFVAPTSMIDLWPWPLTPLTARVVAATFCLGGAGAGVWFDARWTSLRMMLQVEVIMLVLILVAAVRARDGMISGRAFTWPLLIGVVLMLVGSAHLWVSYEVRPGRSPRPA